MKVGISHMAFNIPKLYLSVASFAKQRNIDAEKLKKGLGIHKMAFLDQHEDTATMAANALYKLIQSNQLDPREISRIYLSTESALDNSKPTATYAVEMLENQLEKSFGQRCFKHTDVVDMTFACIGGVDVLQNCLDYVKANPDKKAIVVASDYAKYALNSPGEYTQGAGAVALLVEANPKLLSFENEFGVGFKSEHDFFKPRRFHETAELNGEMYDEGVLQVFRDEPVFDGQFSNSCYQERIKEAYFHLKEQLKYSSEDQLFKQWESIIFHLPYAYHGKRIFSEIYALETKPKTHFSFEELKVISKSDEYKSLVVNKITKGQHASSEIGNMYSASLFMALISDLHYKQSSLKQGDKIGFIAYGSGSKAKVFTGTIEKEFKSEINTFDLEKSLIERDEISFEVYEKLHKKLLKHSINKPQKEFYLDKIEKTNPEQIGARYYKFAD